MLLRKHTNTDRMTMLLLSLLLSPFMLWTPASVSADDLSSVGGVDNCYTMLPPMFHQIMPSRAIAEAPFNVSTSAAVIGQGQTLQVYIVGAPYGVTFSSFALQARDVTTQRIIGRFAAPTGDEKVMLLNCDGSVNNMATHRDLAKKEYVALEWQAPPDFHGDVVFNCSIVQSDTNFWMGLLSKRVRVVRASASMPSRESDHVTHGSIPYQGTVRPRYQPQPRTVSGPIERVAVDPFYTGCGRSKTCFGHPDGCLADNSCMLLSSVMVRGDIYEFELKSQINTSAYVALGLSTDDKMGDDLVIECFRQNGNVMMSSSYTSGPPNYGASRANVPQQSARLLQSSAINGIIYCKVQRDIITNVQGKIFNLKDEKYYLLLASGKSLKENGAGYHDLGRLPSANVINLALVQDLRGSSTLLLRLHGAFMVAAWIGTTSLGILLARYFKQTWTGSQLCGKDHWFAWHRICMVTTWSLTIAAFIIIFVEIDAWSAERNPHAILGLITTILCFLQPFGALLRPAPNSKNRPYFNWLHWLVGNLAHILAIITIFFAVKLAKAQLPEWMDWILVAFVIFHVIVHLIFSIVGCSADRRNTHRVNAFQMGDISHQGMRNGTKIERKIDAPYAGFRKGLLSIYIIILVLFVVILILIVVLAPIEETFRSIETKLNE